MTAEWFPSDRRKEVARRHTGVGMTLARSLLVRTLRHAGLHHVLRGLPCAVGFAVGDDDDREVFVKAGKALLGEQVRDGFAPPARDARAGPRDHHVRSQAKWSRRDAGFVRTKLTARARLFAFACGPDEFPPLLRAAADPILTPGSVDRHALRGAVQAVLGHPPDEALLDAAEGIPLATLG